MLLFTIKEKPIRKDRTRLYKSQDSKPVQIHDPLMQGISRLETGTAKKAREEKEHKMLAGPDLRRRFSDKTNERPLPSTTFTDNE